MAIQKFNEDVVVHQKLGDDPNTDNNLSSEELKVLFDSAAVKIKEYLNKVVAPGIDSVSSTANRAAQDAAGAKTAAENAVTVGNTKPTAVVGGSTKPTTNLPALWFKPLTGGLYEVHYITAQGGDTVLPLKDTELDEAINQVKDIIKIVNPNLVENAWFQVAQLGMISYVAGDWFNNYCFDRWRIMSNGQTVYRTLTSAGDEMATIESTGNALVCIRQYFEDPLPADTYTVSVDICDQTVQSGANGSPFRIEVGNGYASSELNVSIPGSTRGVFTRTFTATKKPTYIQIWHNGTTTDSITIKAIKLERGNVSTLANETKPPYAEDLLKCQRHMVVFNGPGGFATGGSNGGMLFFPIVFPTQLAGSGNPTIRFSGVTAYPFKAGGSKDVTTIGIDGFSHDRGHCMLSCKVSDFTNFGAACPAALSFSGTSGYLMISDAL